MGGFSSLTTNITDSATHRANPLGSDLLDVVGFCLVVSSQSLC